MKRVVINGILYAFDKETEQTVVIEREIRNGRKMARFTIGALYISVPARTLEAFINSETVKQLQRRITELEHTHELDLAEIAMQRRQIDFLMEGR